LIGVPTGIDLKHDTLWRLAGRNSLYIEDITEHLFDHVSCVNFRQFWYYFILYLL